jgi:hypothetical protein
MWRYNVFNEEKEKLCLREGIDENMQDRPGYRELGDANPLFQ